MWIENSRSSDLEIIVIVAKAGSRRSILNLFCLLRDLLKITAAASLQHLNANCNADFFCCFCFVFCHFAMTNCSLTVLRISYMSCFYCLLQGYKSSKA